MKITLLGIYRCKGRPRRPHHVVWFSKKLSNQIVMILTIIAIRQMTMGMRKKNINQLCTELLVISSSTTRFCQAIAKICFNPLTPMI